MKKKVLTVLIAAFAMIMTAQAQVPGIISYQGVLTNSAGTPLNGSQTVTFSFYEAETGGNSVWSETQTVNCNVGVFDAVLGSVTPLNFQFDRQYWLQLTVDNTDLSPRIKLTSSPYALMAAGVPDNSLTLSKLAPPSVNQSGQFLLWNGSSWTTMSVQSMSNLQNAYNSGNTINIGTNPVAINLSSPQYQNDKSALQVDLSVSSLGNTSLRGSLASMHNVDGKNASASVSGRIEKTDTNFFGALGASVDGHAYAGYFSGNTLINGWTGILTNGEPRYELDVNGDIAAYNVHTFLIDAYGGTISAGEIIATSNITTNAGKIGIGKEDPITALDVVGDGAFTGNLSSATLSAGQLSAGSLLVDNNFAAMGTVGVGTSSPVSSLEVNGSMGLKVTFTTSNMTLSTSDNVVICNGATVITLPAAGTCTGRVYTIKNISPNPMMVVSQTGNSIDGTATFTLNNLGYKTIISDGTNWYVIR